MNMFKHSIEYSMQFFKASKIKALYMIKSLISLPVSSSQGFTSITILDFAITVVSKKQNQRRK